VRAFFAPPDDGEEITRIKEAPWLCVVPLCFTALACGVLFFLPDRLEIFLGGIMGAR